MISDEQATNQSHNKQNHTFHKWEALEALQSLVVYMLLRIIEGRHEYTDFDTRLLASLNVSRHGANPLQNPVYSRMRK